MLLAYTTAKPGKHGASKTLFDTKDILSGKNVQHSALPEVVREMYSVIDINLEGYMVLMKNGVLREDIRLPDGALGNEIRKLVEKDGSAEIGLMTIMDNAIVQNVFTSDGN
jgi:translation initiation factor 5A